MDAASSSPPGSPAASSRRPDGVLGDDELRAAIGRRAYAYSRQMVWSAVGADTDGSSTRSR